MHPGFARFVLTCWLLLGDLVQPALAQDSIVPPMPQDMAQVEMFLLTVGRGTQIEALFGHTILRVIDHGSGQDLAYNWGIFDFYDPMFIWNFYRGDLRYMLGIYSTPGLIDYYRNVERRSIMQQQLVLTLKQKTELMQRLIRNALPANVHYQYSQLRDNCATRPRDHLDAILGGKIAEAFKHRPSIATYRYHMKASASPVWWVDMSLDMLTNDVLDVPLSNWHEMFLPLRLQQLLSQVPAFDDSGTEIAHQSLLTAPEWLVDLPDPLPGPDPYAMWSLLVGGPLGLLLLWTWLTPGSSRPTRMLGLSSIVFGFWSAFWATLLVCNWALSRYIETPHNALLWLVWPVDWIFVYYGIRLISKGARPDAASPLGRLVRGTSLLHVVAFAVGATLWMVGLVHQDILPMLASYGLFGALFFVTICCHGAAQGSRSVDA
ncbi:MAG: DUF4105 domain-containing protein [Proteobacteria bacterium]|nr:DUF4105 domain-containing protein [Pseudomonadota bacterium]